MEKTNEHKFQQVKQLRVDLNNIFQEVDEKIKILNDIYSEVVKTHTDKNYSIGLDSFYFQNKLLQLEYDNMQHVFNFIDNRIYGEYYKLHRMLFDFINHGIKEKIMVDKLLITHKKYPMYKDLEPTKIYDFNVTIEINNTIQHSIKELKEYLSGKKQELAEQKKQSEMGINIHSIIHEQVYNNIILEERIHMFENYLNTFIVHHSKYFSRLLIKMKIMLGIVNEDFHLKKSKIVTKDLRSFSRLDTSKTIDSDTSSMSSTSSTPKSFMDEAEETNVRLLVGDINASKEIQSELNTILQNIPPVEQTTRRAAKIITDI
jgi:hypothetical protein